MVSEVLPDTHRHSRVVAGATGNEEKAAAPADFMHIVLDTSQDDLVGLKVDTTSHGVDHRLRLLKDLLLHERAVVAWKGGTVFTMHAPWHHCDMTGRAVG